MQIVELTQKIVANNPGGIYANLVKEGRMLPGLNPSLDEVVSAVQHELTYGPDQDRAAFLLRILDVPVQTGGLHAAELMNLQNTTGKSPVMVLAGQFEVESNSISGSLTAVSRQVRSVPMLQWAMLILMVIGLFVVLRFIGRLVGRMLG